MAGIPSSINGTALTTHGRYAQPPARDLVHLGPILPACPVCGAMQYWHNHVTDVWECWGCMPPLPRVALLPEVITTPGIQALETTEAPQEPQAPFITPGAPCFICGNPGGQTGDFKQCPACGGTAEPADIRALRDRLGRAGS